MSRWMWIPLLALSLGCGDSSDPATTESAQTSAEENTGASEAAETAQEAAEEVAEVPEGARDLAGLSAEVNDDGTIRISGADRWGNPLDYTYADGQYLRDAVPVLARSVTEEQATALAELAESLPGGDGEGGEEGGEAETPTPEPTGGGGGE